MLALSLLAGAVHAQAVPAASIYKTLTATWSAPISSVPCSATVTTNCVSGYTETITPPAGVTGTTAVTSTTTSYAWSPGGLLYCGTWGISLVANWLDGSGAAATSAPITASAVAACPFIPNPATAVSIGFK